MKNAVALHLAVLLAAGLAADAATAQTSSAAKNDAVKNDAATTSEARADKQAAPAPASGSDSDYVIGSDDVLKIVVWKEAELTETLPVRPDGKISMPLLGDVVAAGMTPTELAESIQLKLKKYITDPRVTVVVNAMNSRRIFVTGEVSHSGAMQIG